MSIQNGSNGDVTIMPDVARAKSIAPKPNETPAPEFIVYIHDGEPVLYKRYDKE